MLLLRFFFAACFPGALKLAIAPASTVAFSLFPMLFAEGVCAIDLRAWRTRDTLGLWEILDILTVFWMQLRCIRF